MLRLATEREDFIGLLRGLMDLGLGSGTVPACEIMLFRGESNLLGLLWTGGLNLGPLLGLDLMLMASKL